jgi:hypothetical protein
VVYATVTLVNTNGKHAYVFIIWGFIRVKNIVRFLGSSSRKFTP